MTIGLQNHALAKRIGPRRETMVGAENYRNNRSTEGVYFIRHSDFIKIGWSAKLADRQKKHFADAERWGAGAKVVAVVHGTRSAESAVKKYFAPHLYPNGTTEDFYPCPELCDFIRWLRNQYFCSVGEDGCKGIVDDVEIVDAQGWLPTPDRRIAHEPDLLLRPDEYPDRIVTGDDYYTPAFIIELARDAMGAIDLDPASHAIANKTVMADRFYTAADNGLLRPWFGRVWLNPPFSGWREFAERARVEWANGRIDMLICLVSATLLTANYFHHLLNESSAIIIPKGRMQFGGPMAGASPTGHMLLAFCRDSDQLRNIRSAFSDGFVVFQRQAGIAL